MSKSDGPAASSFESPRKVGWLYKQGGSGVTSHWRKRWFVADHHYLFYYKKPDDKSPVGILCLPEYVSCYKADAKEKKPNAFLLDKGKESGDAPDGPSKSYLLHSDTEDDMLEWIKALKEEMKPMLGDNKHETLPNGRGQAPAAKKKRKSEPDVKIDPQAFNELSTLAAETPKLTHLTASRPKVRNRRPPKRYAVFHEDDSKEDESPPPSPSITKPLPTPPTPSPLSQAKKGHRPSAPLIPNKPKPLTPPKTARNDISPSLAPEATKTETSSPDAKKKPNPPRKPPKPLPSTPSKTSVTDSTEPTEAPTTPVKKSRPVTKPRSVTDLPSTPTGEAPVPRPRPVPKRRTTVASEDSVPTTPVETTPIKEEAILSPEAEEVKEETKAVSPITEEEVAVLSMTETTPPLEDTTPTSDGKESSAEPVVVESQEASKEDGMELTKTSDDKPEPPEEETDKPEEPPSESVEPTEQVKEEVNDQEPETPAKDGESEEKVDKEDPQAESKEDSESESLYEDMDYDGSKLEKKEEESSGSEYETMEFDPPANPKPIRSATYDEVPTEHFIDKTVDISAPQTNSLAPQPLETSSKGQSTSSYVSMDPTSPLTKDEEYVDMEGGVFKEKKTSTEKAALEKTNSEDDGYDNPVQWGSPISQSPINTTIPPGYDVPRPSSSLSDRGPSPGLISSSGSTGSRTHGSPIMGRKGSKGQADRLSALRAESIDGRSLERDRSPSGGSQGYSKGRTSTPPFDIPGTLRQAKEILRLAHMVKAEADEMKEEARRELELAKRDRHDAQLLKKNAAQILKMAKERLSDSKSR